MHTFVFFCRAYNDIDYSVPVACELAGREDVGSIIYLNQTLEASYKHDFRIEYLLRSPKVTYLDLSDLVSCSLKLGVVDRIRALVPLLDKVPGIRASVSRRRKVLRSKLWKEFDFDQLPLPSDGRIVFVFDYNSSELAEAGLSYATARDILCVNLMHGLDTMSNDLITYADDRANHSFEWPGAMDQYTLNQVNTERYAEKVVLTGVPHDKINVIGCSRFAKTWAPILEEITPQCDDLPKATGKVKVAIMLSKWNYNIWVEESLRVIRFLLSLGYVSVVIKPHTRGMDLLSSDIVGKLEYADILSHPDCHVLGQDAHSRRIIQWSDVVLFHTTSIFLEGLMLDKPMLHLRLTLANKLDCSDIVKGWNVDCRDELEMWLERFKNDRQTRTYTPEEREECLNYFVGDADGKVLRRFADILTSL